MKKKNHYISSDFMLPKQDAEDFSELRGSIKSTAEKDGIPDWLLVQPDPDHPRMIITNKRNGKSTIVPLCGYCYTLKALRELI